MLPILLDLDIFSLKLLYNYLHRRTPEEWVDIYPFVSFTPTSANCGLSSYLGDLAR